MKKLLSIAAALLVISALALPIYADMIVEPGDSFGDSHMNECTYLYRQYVANGESGYVTIWESPISSQQNMNVVNGTILRGGWHYEDAAGETWLCVWSVDDESSQDDPFGWVKESECAVVYDYISFQNEHEDEIYETDCSVYDENFEGIDSFTSWNYPNGKVEYTYSGEMTGYFREYLDYVSSCWDDDSGRTWQYVGYFNGYRNFWVCLSDPGFEGDAVGAADTEIGDAENVPAGDVIDKTDDAQIVDEDEVLTEIGSTSNNTVKLEGEDKVEIYAPAETVPEPENGVTVYVVVGVIAVVAVTSVIIYVFFVRKRK